MASVERFEELQVWQESRLLVKEIYQASSRPPFASDFEMKDQMRAAALSAMNNIAEGFERGGNREFVQFLNIAKGSAGEVRSVLYAAKDQGYIEALEFESLLERALSVSRLCSGLIRYLNRAARVAKQPGTSCYAP